MKVNHGEAFVAECKHLRLKKVAPTMYAALLKDNLLAEPQKFIVRCECGELFTAQSVRINVSKPIPANKLYVDLDEYQ